MKSLFKKRIIDERMELQSLKNARKSWNFLLLATGLCFLIELYVLNWSFYYVVPCSKKPFPRNLYLSVGLRTDLPSRPHLIPDREKEARKAGKRGGE